MRSLTLVLVSIILSHYSFAQVLNNNIQDRFALEVDRDPIFSSTSKSTVEWECINKALTSKCLVYHNDQWFSFSPPSAGRYFVNISGQSCRDHRGIQLIVIEGNPCETNTYRILQCIPQIRQDDVFVQLDSLKPKTQYLINIDGFLADYCEFKIQISEKPKGLPRHIQLLDSIKSEFSQQGRLVKISWVIEEEKMDQLQSFKIYRTAAKSIKSVLINEQSIVRNSYGAYTLEYSQIDSLKAEGTYVYQIFGLQKLTQLPILLTTKTLTYRKAKPKLTPQRHVTIHFDQTVNNQFKVVIYDAANHVMLRKEMIDLEKVKTKTQEIDLSEYIDQGIEKFLILVFDSDSQNTQELYYSVNGAGHLVKE